MKQNFTFTCQKKSGDGQLEVVQWLEVIELLLNQTWIHSPAMQYNQSTDWQDNW